MSFFEGKSCRFERVSTLGFIGRVLVMDFGQLVVNMMNDIELRVSRAGEAAPEFQEPWRDRRLYSPGSQRHGRSSHVCSANFGNRRKLQCQEAGSHDRARRECPDADWSGLSLLKVLPVCVKHSLLCTCFYVGEARTRIANA